MKQYLISYGNFIFKLHENIHELKGKNLKKALGIIKKFDFIALFSRAGVQ